MLGFRKIRSLDERFRFYAKLRWLMRSATCCIHNTFDAGWGVSTTAVARLESVSLNLQAVALHIILICQRNHNAYAAASATTFSDKGDEICWE